MAASAPRNLSNTSGQGMSELSQHEADNTAYYYVAGENETSERSCPTQIVVPDASIRPSPLS